MCWKIGCQVCDGFYSLYFLSISNLELVKRVVAGVDEQTIRNRREHIESQLGSAPAECWLCGRVLQYIDNDDASGWCEFFCLKNAPLVHFSNKT